MNNILLKILCASFIIFGISGSSYAAAPSTDTTALLANNTKENSVIIKTVTVPANVSYPANLQDHFDESVNYVQKFSDKKRNYLIEMYQKGKKYFPKITAVLEHYNLPQELKVLIALESGFNPNAVSGA